MSRVPPSLLYLTIYNPSLRPQNPDKDDEDAEEQAHILFYTSKERAVSRDRMLRQIGLAKALVNFSEMFSPTEPCNDIHSQSKRMVMVCPEPNFWIHIAVELAKTPRPVLDKGKGKTKQSLKDKAKENENEPPLAYDYHDGSVHDLALRAHILRGYERFKLTHGSLTEIILSLGQEALELQLERFFTPWAWMWDMESIQELSLDLGVPLYPLYPDLVKTLDAFGDDLPEGTTAVVVSPPHFIPSTSFVAARYPTALSLHVLSLVPPSREPSERTIKTSDADSTAGTSQIPLPNGVDAAKAGAMKEAGFMGMSAVNMTMPSVALPNMSMPNMSMDVRKWGWLGFGKAGNKEKKTPEPAQLPLQEGEPPSVIEALDKPKGNEEGGEAEDGVADIGSNVADGGVARSGLATPNVDTISLEDAMSSDARSVAASIRSASEGEGVDFKAEEGEGSNSKSEEGGELPAEDNFTQLSEEAEEAQEEVHPPPSINGDTSPTASQASLPPQPPTHVPEFSIQHVHLPDESDVLVTKRRRLLYLRHEAIALILVSPDDVDADDGPGLLQHFPTVAYDAFTMLDHLLTLIQAESDAEKAVLPSATKILQPRDKHVISRLGAQFTDSTPGFAPCSEQFYNGRELLEMGSDISEVFSRGQNPQHWHVVRRGLGVDENGRGVDGEVLLEVSRKEASLTDVDNVLVSVIKRFN